MHDKACPDKRNNEQERKTAMEIMLDSVEEHLNTSIHVLKNIIMEDVEGRGDLRLQYIGKLIDARQLLKKALFKVEDLED